MALANIVDAQVAGGGACTALCSNRHKSAALRRRPGGPARPPPMACCRHCMHAHFTPQSHHASRRVAQPIPVGSTTVGLVSHLLGEGFLRSALGTSITLSSRISPTICARPADCGRRLVGRHFSNRQWTSSSPVYKLFPKSIEPLGSSSQSLALHAQNLYHPQHPATAWQRRSSTHPPAWPVQAKLAGRGLCGVPPVLL